MSGILLQRDGHYETTRALLFGGWFSARETVLKNLDKEIIFTPSRTHHRSRSPSLKNSSFRIMYVREVGLIDP